MTTISVITPSYNRIGFIQAAIDSVLVQGYSEFEHIIVDGGSTDGTLQLLAEYPHLQVNSEPDRGVYDALNKGIGLARGEIIAQLNSDDRFEPGIFPVIVDLFARNPGVDAISAGARIFESAPAGERTLAKYEGIGKKELLYRVTLGAPIFNGWFFRREIFREIGPYSLEFAFIADRDFLIRCHISGLNYLTIDDVFYHYCQHSSSLTMNNLHERQDLVYREIIQLAEKYTGNHSDLTLKSYCAKWRDTAFYELFISAFLRKDPKGMFKIAASAMKKNPGWLFSLIARSPLSIIKYIQKKYGRKN